MRNVLFAHVHKKVKPDQSGCMGLYMTDQFHASRPVSPVTPVLSNGTLAVLHLDFLSSGIVAKHIQLIMRYFHGIRLWFGSACRGVDQVWSMD